MHRANQPAILSVAGFFIAQMLLNGELTAPVNCASQSNMSLKCRFHKPKQLSFLKNRFMG
jgi:hypothetical protein